MKIGFIPFILLFSLIIGLLLLSHHLMKRNALIHNVVELHFGEQGVDDFKRYTGGLIDFHPAGAGFMELDWNWPHLGTLRVVTEESNFEINNVVRVMGTNFTRFKGDGVQTLDITSYLHSAGTVTPIEAYEAYVMLVKELNRKGWKQYFRPYVPRIDKRDNFKHITDPLLGRVIDPTYILTFEEWQQVPSLYFNLYNNEIVLGISIHDVIPYENKDKMVGYEVYFSFTTQRYLEKNLITNSNKMDSSELEQAFREKRIEDKHIRKTREAEMIEKGYRIDESYIDHDTWQYVK